MEKKEYLLFYSQNCQFSKKFIGLLNQFPDLNKTFKKLNIETLDKIPKQLKMVPGIVVENNMLQGQDAFDWLHKKVKECFSAGPSINPKGGFQESSYSFIDESMSDNSSFNFSNITDNKSNKTVDKRLSRDEIKQNEFNNDLDRYMQERAKSTPGENKKPLETPDFSLPV